MLFSGVIANSLAVLLGGIVGLLFRKGLPEKITDTVMQGLGLCVLFVGIEGAFSGENITITVLSIVIGGAVGVLLNIDGALHKLGDWLKKKIGKGSQNGSFSEGFVSATLFCCVGAMAILGALQSGLSGNHETYYAKAIVDGIIALIMAATMGLGVLFAAVPLFLYQGILTFSAQAISGFLTTSVIAEISSAGSILIIGIGLNMLKITNIKVANFVIAPFLPILLSLLF